jgi:hypothetical protein
LNKPRVAPSKMRTCWCIMAVASTWLQMGCASTPRRCSYPPKGGEQCMPIETRRPREKSERAADAGSCLPRALGARARTTKGRDRAPALVAGVTAMHLGAEFIPRLDEESLNH